jgi:hypothetical protein
MDLGPQEGEGMTAWPRILAPALLALAISACLDRNVDGGTDEVENPALASALLDAKGNPVAGSIRVFARTQNPARDSLPVLELPVGGAGLRLTAAALHAAMEDAAEKGIPWGNRDSIAFNLVGTASSLEAFRDGFLLYRDAGGRFEFRRQSAPGAGDYYTGRTYHTRLPLATAVTGYAGSVGPDGVGLGLRILFIPGSPYKAEIASDGSFVLARIAAGRYDVKALDAGGKVYSASDSLGTDGGFAPAEWSEADLIWLGE